MSRVKVLVVGASHGLGKETVKALLEEGYTVTAFARRPERIKLSHPNLLLKSGDVMNKHQVSEAVHGQNAVICTLGIKTRQAIGLPFARPNYILSRGIENIVAAMSASDIKRLICVTAVGTRDSVDLCTPVAKLVLRRGLRWLYKEKDRQEQIITASKLDWTIIRPSALTNGPKKGMVESSPHKIGLLTHIARADVAGEMAGMVDDPATNKKTLVLTYPPKFGDSILWIQNYFG